MSKILPSSFESSLTSIDEWIRRGRFKPASARLRAIAPEVFELKALAGSEPARLKFAQLTRRAGLPILGLRALKPIVRPGARRRGVGTSAAAPAILTEYAALLLRVGATTEASSWLVQVRAEDAPEKLLFESFACFNRWDYAASLAPLEAYCGDPRLAPYARLVGQVNLAAALVAARRSTGDEKAERLLAELIRTTSEAGLHLLYGNAVETLIQLRISQARLEEAIDLLREFETRGLLKPGAESILFAKWEAIALRSGDPDDLKARAKLLEVARQAHEFENWEVVRDCDYHEARIASDQARMKKLYFGTPYPAYRERIVALGFNPLKAGYDWKIQAGANPHRLDAHMGKAGSLGMRLLQLLASDFYRPWRVAELHSMLYPGEHFDWESSPLRVHQLLHRTRADLKEAGSPVRIEETRERYRLSSETAAVMRVDGTPLATGDAGRARELCRKLEEEFGAGRPFSAPEAGTRLGIPGQTLRRWLAQAQAAGEITKDGVTRGVRYRLIH